MVISIKDWTPNHQAVRVPYHASLQVGSKFAFVYGTHIYAIQHAN